MSTRGLFGIRKDGLDKAFYHHADCYPEYLGKRMIELIQEYSDQDLEKIFYNIEIVSFEINPSDEQIEYCRKNGWTDFSVSSGGDKDWYCLTRKLQDPNQLFYYASRQPVYMINSIDFIKDSVFCEYAYILDLDRGMLEYYVGRQKHIDNNGRYGSEPGDTGYYPCKKIKDFDFKELREHDFVKQMVVLQDEDRKNNNQEER